MSTPFDPSKLDLDINNTPDPLSTAPEVTKTPESKDTPKVSPDPLATSQEETSNTQEKTSTTPISDDILLEESSTTDDSLKSKPTPKETPPIEPPKVIDININSLDNIWAILIDKKYDFVTIEPQENEVKITYKKDGIEKSTQYIKHITYSNILLRIKEITKLKWVTTKEAQEGKGAFSLGKVKYDLITKIATGSFWEKVFLKMTKNTDKLKWTAKKKTSLWTIFWFLGAVLFVGLVLWGMFITFVILNAQTVEDVKFFSSLGINLNDINTFISKIITFIFSIILFIETVVLAIFLFKWFLTKKEFKKKKLVYGMISVLLFMITFASASGWMIIDRKIKSLPNWQELAYWDIQIYDNDRLISNAFDKWGSLIADTSKLIWPVTIKFDLGLFAQNESKKWFQIKKFIWDIGWERIETIDSSLIKEFREKGNYDISLIVEEIDLKGETIEKSVDNIPSVSVTHVVELEEEVTKSGGKIMKFDGGDLRQLGKLEWYFWNDLEKPVHEGYSFKPTQVFFEETVIALNILNENSNENRIKVFVVGAENSGSIAWEISYERDIVNDLKYTLKVSNPETAFGDGFIEEFEWKIWDKTIKKTADPLNLEKSSQIEFEFDSYGENEVSVTLTDASGKINELTTIVDIPRNLWLKKNLDIWNGDEKITDLRYIEKGNEYFLDELGIPTKLKFDARFVRPENLIYSLKEVSWDFGNNSSIDATGKTAEYEVFSEGNQTVLVEYKFVHRKDPDDVIKLEEFIYIEWVKKDAVVDFKIEAETDYTPVTVRFDASKSTIKNDDVVKFEYDYGDGIVEVRDAINPGHRYTEPGDYTVKLTITGRSGKKYSAEKQLILKPAPQDVEIWVSLKNAPVWQGIDFSSDNSDGQIIEYFWDFGDGNTSVEANPTHSYDTVGNYEVQLRVDFVNNNSLSDAMTIEIY